MISITMQKRIQTFDLDINVQCVGGVVAVFGPSGSGKTTIANAIAGLVQPDHGNITIGNHVLFDSQNSVDVRPERRRIGYVFQDDRLFPHLSVRRNLTYGKRYGSPRNTKSQFDKVVDILGLNKLLDRPPTTLSGGEKQRVSIGRALLSSPQLLLMDEPLSNLDQARRIEILSFIEQLRDTFSIPILYVSHSVEEIVRIADQVVAISNGRLLAQGTVDTVMNKHELGSILGPFDIGVVMEAQVSMHDEQFHLTRLSVPAGKLDVARINLPIGQGLRVRIRARDVILAQTKPERISTLNVLKGSVIEVTDSDGPQVDVLVDVGSPLWARVTTRSAKTLELRPGTEVYALIKAVAIDRGVLQDTPN